MISEIIRKERHELLGWTFHVENVRQEHWDKITKMSGVMGNHQVYSAALDRWQLIIMKIEKEVIEEEKLWGNKSRDAKARVGNNRAC